MKPKVGRIYQYNGNKVIIISKDYTKLNRKIVYAQLLDVYKKFPVPFNSLKDERIRGKYELKFFALWDFDWPNLRYYPYIPTKNETVSFHASEIERMEGKTVADEFRRLFRAWHGVYPADFFYSLETVKMLLKNTREAIKEQLNK